MAELVLNLTSTYVTLQASPAQTPQSCFPRHHKIPLDPFHDTQSPSPTYHYADGSVSQ